MYSYKEIIRYSDVDKNGYLPLYGILEAFQNCINFQSKEIGRDYKSMRGYGKAWVLVSWKIKLVKPIEVYDSVEVGTWSHGYDKMFGYRNYVILDDEGNRLAYADTTWVLIDLETRMLKRVEDSDLGGYETGERIEMKPVSRKLRLSDDKVQMEPVKVLKTYIDTNGHMNNAAYFRLAQEYIPDDFEYNTIDAVYVKETTEGMTMIPFVHNEENGIGISFVGEDGTVFTNIRLYTEK